MFPDVAEELREFCIPFGPSVHLKIEKAELSDDFIDIIIEAVQKHSFVNSLSLKYVGCGPKMAVVIADMLERNHTLTSCDLSGNAIGSHGSKCLSMSLMKNSTLRKLTLRHCSLGTDGLVDWLTFIQNGKNSTLDTLDLSYNRIDDEGAQDLADTFQSLKYTPSLTRRWHIHLLGNAISDQGIKLLARMMQTNMTIATLEVANAKSYDIEHPESVVFLEHCARRNTRKIQSQGLLGIVNLLTYCADVQSAIQTVSQSVRRAEITRIENILLTEVDCVKLAHALSQSHGTTHLYLRNNALTLAGLHLLLPSLRVNESLYRLTLVDNNVGGVGVLETLQSIARHPNSPLRELHVINSMAITPNTCQATWPRQCNASIYQLLIQGPPLTAITLANCALKDADIGALVSGLAWGCVLEHLNVARNQFTDHVLPVFSHLMQRCRSLSSLDVGGNQCTLEGYTLLVSSASQHKNLHILRLGRVATLDSHIVTIANIIQSNDLLNVFELVAVKEHSRYKPFLKAIHTKVANNRSHSKVSLTQGQIAENVHKRKCRLQSVGGEVARNFATQLTSIPHLTYMVERHFMTNEDVNVTKVLDAFAMVMNDYNASSILFQLGELTSMTQCDINAILISEQISMNQEDIRF